MELDPFSSLPSSMYWSALPELDDDFTAEDPLALDYLGQQLGNWMFPGFTTRTSRAQYYLVVLYGLHLADCAIRQYGYPGDDESRVKLFERWERLWALATFEYWGGAVTRGHPDAMRGVRGARRAWASGQGSLPLDFTLISRQSELAGLGAYLSSLRHYRLVVEGTLKPSPAARALIDRFWFEAEGGGRSHLYEKYVLEALDPRISRVSRSAGHVTLALVGEKTRLGAIQGVNHKTARRLLGQVLIDEARDPMTLPYTRQLEAAARAGVNESEAVLAGMCDSAWEKLGAEQRSLASLGLVFGRLAVALLARFNCLYNELVKEGWVADLNAVAGAVFTVDASAELRRCCGDLDAHPERGRFAALTFHGPQLLRLTQELASDDPAVQLTALLHYHSGVQRARRGGAWIRPDGSKLTLVVTHYNGYRDEARFPSFKLWTMQSLLRDLGRID